MKMKIFSRCPGKIMLTALLLSAFLPTAKAQTISQVSPTRDTVNDFSSYDSIYGPYFNTYPGDATNGVGVFHASDTSVTPGGQHFVGAQSSCLQDSLITASATSLSVTGHVQMTGSGGVSMVDGNSGSASWLGYSRVTVSFNLDKPFNYSLQASTLFVTNQIELAPAAYLVLSRNQYPDVAAFGNSRHAGYTSLPAAGTSSGVLPAGSYTFHAEASESGGVDFIHSPTAENYFVSFTLTVTPVPQPPVITAFIPNGTGAFNLIWNAPQAGNYRVLSSTDLTAWSELIPSSARPSGLNTNVVSAITGSNQGFFRVEYLP